MHVIGQRDIDGVHFSAFQTFIGTVVRPRVITLYFLASFRSFSVLAETRPVRIEFFAFLKAGKTATCAMCPKPTTA